MGRGVDIPWIGSQNTMARGVKIPWVDIPLIGGSKYHGSIYH